MCRTPDAVLPDDMLLEELGVFSPELLEVLRSHAIHTLGQLLGATHGLVLRPEFFEAGKGIADAFESIANRFPEEVERYRQDAAPLPPTGCLLEEPGEGESDDGDS